MARSLLFFLALSIPFVSHAQTGMSRFGSARASALALSTTADAFDTGAHINPAVAAARAEGIVTVFGRQPFGLPELRHGSLGARIPLSAFTLHSGAGTYGFKAYRETFFSLAAARQVSVGTSRTLSVGFGARYHHVMVEGYESAHAVALQGGIYVPVLATLSAGATARNLTGADVAGSPLPRSLAIGLHYRPTSLVNVYGDVFKDVAYPWSLRGGIEVWPVPRFAVRFGAARHPARLSVGVGVNTGLLTVDVSAERHPELGWSPAAGLSARW